jgi:single-stranded DNA-binding protein
MYMNRVTLVGFTGGEAKHTNAQGGKGITRLRYKSGNEWKDNTQWHDCVVYNASVKGAETIQKGDHLLIEGELKYREYERTMETTEGPVQVQWPKTEVIVHSITRLNRPAKQEKGAAA